MMKKKNEKKKNKNKKAICCLFENQNGKVHRCLSVVREPNMYYVYNTILCTHI